MPNTLAFLAAVVALAIIVLIAYNRRMSPTNSRGPSEQPSDVDAEPSLRNAEDFAVEDVGSFAWDTTHNADLLVVSDEGTTVTWAPPKPDYKGKYPPAWVPIRSTAHLHSGDYSWDFVVEKMGGAQLGVGFMLLWDQGLDWGFFGYLGAGSTAWSYDPSTGDVVTQTESIAGGLPTFANGQSGTVSVRLHLPRTAPGKGVFVVEGIESPAIELPAGAVVVPAACLLKEGQQVQLAKTQAPPRGRGTKRVE